MIVIGKSQVVVTLSNRTKFTKLVTLPQAMVPAGALDFRRFMMSALSVGVDRRDLTKPIGVNPVDFL